MRRLGCLLLAALVAGCTLGPDYQRPALDLPGGYRGQAPAAADQAASFGDLNWFAVFSDPALQALIREALANNHDLLIAAERVLQAREQVTVARSYYYPSVGVGGSYENLRVSEKGLSGLPAGAEANRDQKFIYGELSWELDFFGRIRRSSEAARAEFLASQENRVQVQRTLVTAVTQAYLDLLELDLELEITRRTAESRQESLRLANYRWQFGYDNLVSVRMAENLLYSATKAIPDLRRLIAQKENQLCILLGRNPGPIARGRPLLEQEFSAEVPAGLPARLLTRRPDIRAAEQQLIAANARIGQAKAQLFPTISLTAQGGYQSRQLSGLLSGSAGFWDLLAGLTMPVFNAGRLEANVRASESIQRETAVAYQRAVQTALQEVADALAAVGGTRDYRQQQAKQTAALLDQVKLARLRYYGGVTNYLEVLDSERQSFQAEIDLSRARRDEMSALVALYRALGGGWQESDLETAAHAEPARPGGDS